MLRNIVSRWPVYAAVMIVGIALVLAGVGTHRASATVAPPSATVVTLLTPREAHTGELITVRLVAHNAHSLAGFQSTLSFDPARLRLTGATIAKGLARGGRGIVQLGPVLRDGAVVLGAATCPAASCTERQPAVAAARFQAVDGDVELATVDFYVVTPGSYALTLSDVRLVDAQGVSLATEMTNALLDVSAR